MTDLNY